MDFKADFKQKESLTKRVGIHVRIAGSGFPVLLLHGYPQTGYMWHKRAPLLAILVSWLLTSADMGNSDKPKLTAISPTQNVQWLRICEKSCVNWAKQNIRGRRT